MPMQPCPAAGLQGADAMNSRLANLQRAEWSVVEMAQQHIVVWRVENASEALKLPKIPVHSAQHGATILKKKHHEERKHSLRCQACKESLYPEAA